MEQENTKKYILSTDPEDIITIELEKPEGKILKTPHRIIATEDIVNEDNEILVEKGAKGGYVESRANLSEEGTCWIYDDAVVCEQAQVCDNAEVKDCAQVYGNACVDDRFVTGEFGGSSVNNNPIKENKVVSESEQTDKKDELVECIERMKQENRATETEKTDDSDPKPKKTDPRVK